MPTKITERDKRLLYILSLALVVVLFFRFAFLPALEHLDTLQTELDTAEQTRMAMETQIAVLDWVDEAITTNTARLQKANSTFYPAMSNDAIDTLVTGIVLEHNLVSLSLQIAPTQAQLPAAYFASEQAQQPVQPAPENTDTQQAEPTQQEEATGTLLLLPEVVVQAAGEQAAGYVLASTVSCTVSGSREDFLQLLNDLERAYPAIHVESFSLTDTPYLTQQLTVQQGAQFGLTLTVYMCDKERDAK